MANKNKDENNRSQLRNYYLKKNYEDGELPLTEKTTTQNTITFKRLLLLVLK